MYNQKIDMETIVIASNYRDCFVICVDEEKGYTTYIYYDNYKSITDFKVKYDLGLTKLSSVHYYEGLNNKEQIITYLDYLAESLDVTIMNL